MLVDYNEVVLDLETGQSITHLPEPGATVRVRPGSRKRA
jgi:hypothetical protein